jgi:hypothetical protein
MSRDPEERLERLSPATLPICSRIREHKISVKFEAVTNVQRPGITHLWSPHANSLYRDSDQVEMEV